MDQESRLVNGGLMMAENNAKKKFGRRAGFGIGAITLVTVAFYICLFKDVDLNWFVKYASIIVGVYGFIVGGLTVTDVLGKR